MPNPIDDGTSKRDSVRKRMRPMDLDEVLQDVERLPEHVLVNMGLRDLIVKGARPAPNEPTD